MAKKSYSFYPGCSSQKAASAANYMVSVNSMCETLDIELNEIPDWNCCSASIGYAGGGELPRLALSARNMAISEQANPGQDIVATCAACWLATREAKERLNDDEQMFVDANAALAEAGLKIEGKVSADLKAIVDPSVVGGVVATIGDTVIDDSVRTRIDQLKSRL